MNDEAIIPDNEDAHGDIFPTPEDKVNVLARLRLLGVHSVDVAFSGGGDSGTVEGVYAVDAQGNRLDLSNEMIDGWEVEEKWDTKTGKRTKEIKRSKRSLDDQLITMTYDALEQTQLDWYNNDGGQGELHIYFAESPPLIELEIGINYTETAQHEFQFN